MMLPGDWRMMFIYVFTSLSLSLFPCNHKPFPHAVTKKKNSLVYTLDLLNTAQKNVRVAVTLLLNEQL